MSFEQVGVLSFQTHIFQGKSLFAEKTCILKIVHSRYLCTKYNSVCNGKFNDSHCVYH